MQSCIILLWEYRKHASNEKSSFEIVFKLLSRIVA